MSFTLNVDFETAIKELVFVKTPDGSYFVDCWDRPSKKHPNKVYWQELTDSFMAKSGQCARCPSTDSLALHHWTYATFGKEREQDVELLCRTCHQKIHGFVDDCKLNNIIPLSADDWVILSPTLDSNNQTVDCSLEFHSFDNIVFELLEGTIVVDATFQNQAVHSEEQIHSIFADHYTSEKGIVIHYKYGALIHFKLRDISSKIFEKVEEAKLLRVLKVE